MHSYRYVQIFSIQICVHTYVCIYTYMFVYIYLYIDTCISIYICMGIYVCIHIYIYICMGIYVCIHIYRAIHIAIYICICKLVEYCWFEHLRIVCVISLEFQVQIPSDNTQQQLLLPPMQRWRNEYTIWLHAQMHWCIDYSMWLWLRYHFTPCCSCWCCCTCRDIEIAEASVLCLDELSTMGWLLLGGSSKL